ncbi:MBOAT family O-acyltransferase [Spirosoma fluviale]|uniref:D-alanyl-lipoteichoic acid acyltransferase DltB, MBOAT superfamily n=1 Tax=Spirosoma fluviale TaxID=1597977 RepID=A0A286FZS1_9BACT|nr:MBOAT family O-acyltransferase [Spirosoma fluviale]SOD88708.1 D-alanyl-lipoteichoic acid acyltransferase DltB, MBOAT superfamily [Spirosoma fluviale]
MLFNSLEFALFLPTVFLLYWFVFNKKLKQQNLFLILVSYLFYSFWDWRFLFLLIFSTFLDYYTGLRIFQSDSKKHRKIWLFTSIGINLGFLGYFKYYNFFIESFANLLHQFGLGYSYIPLTIILPIGISFYTFHGLSYVIDIYYGRVRPTTNYVDYSLFVSFFPLLVAGPIERATHLLPQVQVPRKFDANKAADGLRQILWGLFKKVVIADGCAMAVNKIFDNSSEYTSSSLILGAVLFSFQIYGDFSGYSDIALGVARLFGFELLQNFKFPYFSRDVAEFWRRWHISLSSWFKDYLYIPLGGSKGGTWTRIRNTFIIFLVSGFWHGANWTFIIWGLLHALFIVPSIIFNTNRRNLSIVAAGRWMPTVWEFSQILFTFGLVSFAWIFFRSESLSKAFTYISGIFSSSIFKLPNKGTLDKYLLANILIFMAIEWIGRENKYAIEKVGVFQYKPVRWLIYSSIIFFIGMFMKTTESPFIYFQF